MANDQQRKTVRSMAAYGVPQEEIAHCMGLRSAKTLRDHFRKELDRATAEANAQVAQTLYQMATSGKNIAATIFWLKARARWQERGGSAPPVAAPPLVIMTYAEGE
jgi:hypothetical protein